MIDSLSEDSDHQMVTIYSIGHSNHSLETFLELLKRHGIQVLVDIRSYPYSTYVPHFNSSGLAPIVERNKVKYLFMGKELGGRPDGDEFYDAADHVLYSGVAESSFFRRGIQRLEEEAKAAKVAIMCSEEDPTGCHRHLLVGRVLTERGVSLLHIRDDGHLQTEKELAPHEEVQLYEQSLWGEQLPSGKDQEVPVWRSIRSVSRKKRPPNFSDL